MADMAREAARADAMARAARKAEAAGPSQLELQRLKVLVHSGWSGCVGVEPAGSCFLASTLWQACTYSTPIPQPCSLSD